MVCPDTYSLVTFRLIMVLFQKQNMSQILTKNIYNNIINKIEMKSPYVFFKKKN